MVYKKGDVFSMNPLWESWHIHIDVTQYCHDTCLYCSRYVRHQRPDHKYNMSLNLFEKALWSLREFPNRIGLMGGEPTMHPKFDQLCEIIQKEPVLAEHGKYKGYLRYSLFTAGGRGFEKHKEIIDRTFQHIEVFKHTPEQKSVCKHQPTTMAMDDMVKDEELKARLIDDCWAQKTWCPNITPKGAFFCELAAGIDRMLDGPGGWPIEKYWWKKTPAQYRDQVDRYCGSCGIPLPVEREVVSSEKERVSSGLLQKMRACNLPRLTPKDIVEVKEPFTNEEINEAAKTWTPGEFRQDLEK